VKRLSGRRRKKIERQLKKKRPVFFLNYTASATKSPFRRDNSERLPWEYGRILTSREGESMLSGEEQHSVILLAGVCRKGKGVRKFTERRTAKVEEGPLFREAAAKRSQPAFESALCVVTTRAKGGRRFSSRG